MKRAALVAAVGIIVTAPVSASAYEFEVRALTIGQGLELRAFRPLSGDFSLDQRRFTQTLTLNIWDIGGRRNGLRLYDARIPRGPEISFVTYLRVDNDFGAYTGGDLALGSRRYDAVDLIPELQSTSLNLDLLYGYLSVKGAAAGLVDLDLGRQLIVDTLDWWSFDGALVRVHAPWRFAVEGFGGLRVRDSSPLGSSVQELDGTSGAQCAEYVEGSAPGSGSWRPIDSQAPVGTNPFENDFDLCPQRDQRMPTYGGAIQTEGLPVHARLAYRRTVSRTPGLIGAADRFEFEDTGMYPNDGGAAPGWGVNEERLAVSVRWTRAFARGTGRVTPYGAVRYSFLHGVMDQQNLGLRARYGMHSLSPEYFVSFPTFDGDSIFNVFSVTPYRDLRLTYEISPKSLPVRAYLRGWARRYDAEDGDASLLAKTSEFAGGGQLGARYRRGPWSYVRLDLFHEDGYGGRRTGAYTSMRWRLSGELDLTSRVSVIRFQEDSLAQFEGTTFGSQVGGTYRINEGIAVHVVAEENVNRFYSSQFRLVAMLDLAHHPEP